MDSNVIRRVFICILDDTFNEVFNNKFFIISSLVSNALLISHDVRKDSALHIYFLKDGIYVTLLGNRIRQIRPDEQSLKGIFRKVTSIDLSVRSFAHIHTGVIVRKEDLSSAMKHFIKGLSPRLNLVQSSKGLDIRSLKFKQYKQVNFIMALNLNVEDLIGKYKLLDEYLPVRVSKSLKNSPQLITLVNNEIDRQIYTSM